MDTLGHIPDKHKNTSLGLISVKLLKHTLSIAGILILSTIVYAKSLGIPAIFGDDWIWYVELSAKGGLKCPTVDNIRFFYDCWPLLQYNLFGLDIYAYHLSTLIAFLVTIILLYCFLNQVLPRYNILVFAATVLFAVYPSENIRYIWLISGYCSIAYGLLIISIILLVHFSQTGKWHILIFSLLTLFCALGLYEAIVGLAAAAAIGVFIFARYHSWPKRLATLAPVLLCVVYAIWRWQMQIRLGDYVGHKTGDVELSMMGLLLRILTGYRVSLQWGWTTSLQLLFPWMQSSGDHSQAAATMFLLGIVIVLIALLLLWKYTKSYKSRNMTSPELPVNYDTLIIITILSFCVIGAGYFPLMLAVLPGLSFETSRINALPAMGSSVFIVSILILIIQLLGYRGREATVALVVLLTPFIFMGINTKNSVQEETAFGWQEQKDVWQQMFKLVPDIGGETYVILIFTGEPERLGASPFMAGIPGMTSAVSVLYGHPINWANYKFGDLNDIEYLEDGLRVYEDNPIVPYEEALLLLYDSQQRKMEIIRKIPEFVSQKLYSGIVLCKECILDQTPGKTQLRWLVE